MSKAKKYYLALVFLLIFHSCVFANQNSKSKIELRKIIAIESKGDVKAYNHRSKARGLCQITPICLKEYNAFHKVKYTAGDLFNKEINIYIASWYLEIRIPQMLKYYKKLISTRNILISYNAGISYVVRDKELKQETKDYIIKYERR